ncbi:hypothetical protein GE09DRAFT_1281945 [Coniochaeta sp. 2T2.1]|nr:hypothetical protein GE09DRAFT_1281945 [Coniochaeta sp. 2T2.1]
MDRPSRGRAHTFPGSVAGVLTKIFGAVASEVKQIEANETVGWQPQTRRRSRRCLTAQHVTATSFVRDIAAAPTLKRHLTSVSDIPEVEVTDDLSSGCGAAPGTSPSTGYNVEARSCSKSCSNNSSAGIAFVSGLLKPVDTSSAASKLRQREKSPYPGAKRSAELPTDQGTSQEPQVRIRGRTLEGPTAVLAWLAAESDVTSLGKTNDTDNISLLQLDPDLSDPESDDADSDLIDDDDASISSFATSDCASYSAEALPTWRPDTEPIFYNECDESEEQTLVEEEPLPPQRLLASQIGRPIDPYLAIPDITAPIPTDPSYTSCPQYKDSPVPRLLWLLAGFDKTGSWYVTTSHPPPVVTAGKPHERPGGPSHTPVAGWYFADSDEKYHAPDAVELEQRLWEVYWSATPSDEQSLYDCQQECIWNRHADWQGGYSSEEWSGRTEGTLAAELKNAEAPGLGAVGGEGCTAEESPPSECFPNYSRAEEAFASYRAAPNMTTLRLPKHKQVCDGTTTGGRPNAYPITNNNKVNATNMSDNTAISEELLVAGPGLKRYTKRSRNLPKSKAHRQRAASVLESMTLEDRVRVHVAMTGDTWRGGVTAQVSGLDLGSKYYAFGRGGVCCLGSLTGEWLAICKVGVSNGGLGFQSLLGYQLDR